jgi:V8-like Glu-specific endopeptidase
MPLKLLRADRKILLDALIDTPQFLTARGRRSFISNELSSYPLSQETADALKFVNWEGNAFEVADQLLDYLEGQEPAPGVPALAIIAQAIEPVTGTDHREKLKSLRNRMNWGAVAPPAEPATSWSDHRSKIELGQERILGENTLKPTYYLRRALVAAEAVVRVDVYGLRKGTGFLVTPDLMMTNHHVLANQEEARNAQVHFFDDVPDDRDKGQLVREPLVTYPAADPLVYTNPTLDFSFVRLQGAPPLTRYLPLRPKRMQQNQRVVIIQHPGGYPKQISLQNNMVAYADDKIVQYYTSTKAGSSGAPVFDDNFDVVAIHYRWVHNPDWDGGQLRITDPKQVEDLQYRNQGTSMIAIFDDLTRADPTLLDEILKQK